MKRRLLLQKSNATTGTVKEASDLVIFKRATYYVLTPRSSKNGGGSLKMAIIAAMENPEAVGILVVYNWLDKDGNECLYENRLIFGSWVDKKRAEEICQEEFLDDEAKMAVKDYNDRDSLYFVPKIKGFVSYGYTDNSFPLPNYKDILLSKDWPD